MREHDAATSRPNSALYKVTFGSDKFFEPYIVSFCGHKETYERENGLLTQWRGYSHGAGYAIVFDTKKLSDLLKAEADFHFYGPGHMCDVIYEGDDEGFKREFAELIKTMDEVFPRIFNQKGPPYDALYPHFISSVSRYKHQGFREEQEVRILLSPVTQTAIERQKMTSPQKLEKSKQKVMKRIHFKEALVPYIKIFDQRRAKLPIEKIIVGPHADKEARRDRLIRYMELRRMDIDVSCSQTPLQQYR